MTTDWIDLSRRAAFEAGGVNAAGLRCRQELETRLDRVTIPARQALGADTTRDFIDLLEPVSDRFIDRVDATAGTNWLPAGRERVWLRYQD